MSKAIRVALFGEAKASRYICIIVFYGTRKRPRILPKTVKLQSRSATDSLSTCPRFIVEYDSGKNMKLTPVRKQYLEIKQRYPGAIVFFRLGDFYETFDEDAKLVSRILEITLTSRELGKGNKVPLAGIPYHALNSYLGKLINRGYKVAVCEQLSPPGKGLVDRDVVRVATPGTVVEPSLLDGTANNYLASVVIENDLAGLAYVDITTAEFAATQLPTHRLLSELERLQPSEILFPGGLDLPDLSQTASLTPVDKYCSEFETASETLIDHFDVATLEGYGCSQLPLAVRAAGAIIHYLLEIH